MKRRKKAEKGTERVSESGGGQRPVPKYKSGGRDGGEWARPTFYKGT